ncbi:MAG: hypothetical protein Q9199_001652 [Rusavskia elegans]
MTSKMDEIQGLNAQYPGFSPKLAAGYLPAIAPFDYSGWFDHGHNWNSQNAESKEMIVLRSKLALAESCVEELRKDKAEAKNVIDYLLKLNAGAGFHKESPYAPVPCVVPQYTHNSRSAGDVNDILNPIIALLHDIVRAGPLDRNPRTLSAPRPTLGSGNLLDLLDEEPRSEDEAKGVKDSSKPSSTPLECPKVTEPAGASQAKIGKDYVEQTDAPETDLMIFETGTSFTAPLVTRFGNARTKPGFQEDSSVKYPLQKSFDESETGLSGSTQYDASQSGSTSSASPISSVHNSDDENEQQPKSRSIVEDNSARTESKGSGEWDATTPAIGAVNGNASAGFSLSANPQLGITALFMPKWRVLPYTMAALERANAILLHQRLAAEKEKSFPGFFRFGIRFRPDSKVGNIFRTVVVDNLPPKFAISTLLLQIQGGAVMDAKLLNTIGIHGRTTALITFVREQAAKAFEDRALLKPLYFDGLQARVVLLPSPTWPMAPALQTGVLQHGYTRCLEVRNFPRSIKPTELEQDLQMCHSVTSYRIEAKRLRSDGILELRFTSVKYARIAWGVFSNHQRYRQCTCEHMPDPCAQPWDEASDMLRCPQTHPEPCVKQPENANHVAIATNVAAVTRWKDYAYDTYTGVPSLPQARIGTPDTFDDRTYRLSDADVNDAATMQRGRGFTTKQSVSVSKPEDTCNPQ